MNTDLRLKLELQLWERKMQAPPGLLDRLSKGMQARVNRALPEAFHKGVTTVVQKMVEGVLFGAKYINRKPVPEGSIAEREDAIAETIRTYRTTASIEGGVTGAGGIFMGLADFPLLLAIKLKLLFHIASLYGFDVKDYRERLYTLHIFELAFSSQQHRQVVFAKMKGWDEKVAALPESVDEFDWRSFQQEYRDYIDLAKLAQLIPFIGAPVGAIVNYRLVKKLGYTAMLAYRMRRI